MECCTRDAGMVGQEKIRLTNIDLQLSLYHVLRRAHILSGAVAVLSELLVSVSGVLKTWSCG